MKTAILLFVGFLKTKNSRASFGLIFENSWPKGFSWENIKKSVIWVLRINSRYLQSTALKWGGGVGSYVQNGLDYKLHPECNFSDLEVIESLFLEIIMPQGKNVIVGSIYRSPNYHVTAFLDKFNDILSIISKEDKCCYNVMGDYNLDLLQYNHHVRFPPRNSSNVYFHTLFYHSYPIQLAWLPILQH